MAGATDFSEMVMDHAQAVSSEPFETQVYYDRDGDCIEFLTAPDDFYAERVDNLVTVYYSRESGEIIGSLIKGVSTTIKSILDRMPGFKIEIQDGRVRLEHLFAAQIWADDENHSSPKTITYQKLREAAEKTDAVAELTLA